MANPQAALLMCIRMGRYLRRLWISQKALDLFAKGRQMFAMRATFDSEKAIADVIRARIGYRKPQTALADELGVSRSYLSEVLAGKKKPGPGLLRALGYDPSPYYRKAECKGGRNGG